MRKATNRRRGFGLLEVMVSMVLLSGVLLSSTVSLMHAHRLGTDSELRRIAREALQNELEEYKATEFATVAAIADGATFAVAGLPLPSTGTQGQVTIFLNEADKASPALGLDTLGFDLNGNGTRTDVLAVTDAYRLLPMRFQVSWTGSDGLDETMQLDAVLSSPTNFMQLGG